MALVAVVAMAWSHRQPPRPLGDTRLVAYNDFEVEVRDKVYKEAVVDGNIISLAYLDTKEKPIRVEAPDVGRAVGLLIKFEVFVRAVGPRPANGLSVPAAVTLTLPYLLLSLFCFGVIGAARGSIQLDRVEQELAKSGDS